MIELNEEKQKLLLDYIYSTQTLYSKVRKILKPEYFDSPLNIVVEFVEKYFTDYHMLPSFDIIKVESGVELEPRSVNEDQFNYIVDEIEVFCKNVAFRKAVVESADEILNGSFGNAQSRIQESLSINIDSDLGINIFDNPKLRILTQEADNDPIAIGWDDYDKQTNLSKRGELTLIAGSTGSGKSVVLTNIANLLSKQGLNVVYISLELKSSLVGIRMDSIITGVEIGKSNENLDKIESIYNNIKFSYGDLAIKKMPVGTNSNDIRSYLFEYQLQKDYVPDCIIVDHLDLMEPCKYSSRDGIFDKDKQTTEELREIFIDYNAYGFTASQLNRSSIDIKNKSQAHIAGGISKINTSDVAVAILRTEEQIDNNIVELQFLKLRNASMKVYPVLLHWDDKTLKIDNPNQNSNLVSQQNDARLELPNFVTDKKMDLERMMTMLDRGK